MQCLSFPESMIMWFTSYLSNLSFTVGVGKEFSSLGKLTCSVPQRSILSPLLCLLDVNICRRPYARNYCYMPMTLAFSSWLKRGGRLQRLGNASSGTKLPLFFHFPVIHNKPHHLPFLNLSNPIIQLHYSNSSIRESPFP